jgi:hypothetical protein
MPIKGPRGAELLEGEVFTLYPSTVTTAVVGALGTAVVFQGERQRFALLLDVTAAAAAANDTLDVYVDCLISGTTWINAVHFTQVLGNGGALKRYATLDPTNPGTADILVTTDATSGVVRPGIFGQQMRARWTVVNGTGASFTFAVTGYAVT